MGWHWTRSGGERVLAAAMALTAVLAGPVGCGDDSDGSAGPDDVVDAPEDLTSLPDDADGLDEDAFGTVEIPDDIPLPDDDEVVEAIGNPTAGYTVFVRSAMAVGDVAAFYEEALPAAGWESVERTDAGGAEVVSVEAQKPSEDNSIRVQISSDGDGTSVQIFTGGPPG